MMPTNHELHILLTEIRGDMKLVLEEQKKNREWQDTHDDKDSERFGKLHSRIDSMNKYAASIAIVASGIGMMFTYVWNKLTGNG